MRTRVKTKTKTKTVPGDQLVEVGRCPRCDWPAVYRTVGAVDLGACAAPPSTRCWWVL